MRKQPNETIGTCPCSMKGCNEQADVRKMKGKGRWGKLYLVCPVHMTIRPDGAVFQDYILDNAEMFSPGNNNQEDELTQEEHEAELENELEQQAPGSENEKMEVNQDHFHQEETKTKKEKGFLESLVDFDL